MKRWLHVVGVVVAGALLASCGAGRGIVTPSPTLLGSNWRLVSIEGEEPLADIRVTVVFAEEHVSGSAGCNSYSGSLTLRGERIDVGLLASTQVFCTAPGVMDQEQRFLAALQRARSFRIAGSELQILAADGSLLLVFRIESQRT